MGLILNLTQDSPLHTDFKISSEGESIYLEPVSNYLEGSARRVSMEVYDDTAPGVATLIIVGELESIPDGPSIFADSTPVPQEFEGHYKQGKHNGFWKYFNEDGTVRKNWTGFYRNGKKISD